jgi:thiol-disulfide isomerase/thioredoxin
MSAKKAASFSALSIALYGATGCGEDAPSSSGPTRRSDVVTASPTISGTTKPLPITSQTAAPRTGPLCTATEEIKLPETKFASISKTDIKTELTPELPQGVWLWVNFWAAWCGPCKEEIPRILAFEKKLRAEGIPLRVGFVSLDDDERQARKYLEGQPKEGLGVTLWLEEGENRSKFLNGLKLGPTPNLPVQVFVKPSGDVHCIVKGAVEDRDYAEIAAFTKK